MPITEAPAMDFGLGEAPDGAERIADFLGHRRGHPAQGRQPLVPADEHQKQQDDDHDGDGGQIQPARIKPRGGRAGIHPRVAVDLGVDAPVPLLKWFLKLRTESRAG
jgi:hypothetical protein